MTKQEFFRSKLTITVLSDRPIEGLDISHVIAECDDGDMVMGATVLKTEKVTRAEMDKALSDAGSDPDFFPEEDDT